MFFKRRPKPSVDPEWMIVGLGNPGSEYAGTRHNVGFETVDRLAVAHRIKLDRSKHRARYGVGYLGESAVALVKPLTFMNLSGQAVAPLAREWNLPPDRILVVADDVDIKVAVVRVRRGGSAGGHNGHKSLIQHLRSQEYPRVKIGVGKAGETSDHVLSRFAPAERTLIDDAVAKAARAAEMVIQEGLERAMLATNERGAPDD